MPSSRYSAIFTLYVFCSLTAEVLALEKSKPLLLANYTPGIATEVASASVGRMPTTIFMNRNEYGPSAAAN